MNPLLSFISNDSNLLNFNVYFQTIKARTDLIKIELELEHKLQQRVQLRNVSLGDDVDYHLLKTMIITNSIDSQLLRSRLCHLHIELHSVSKRLKDKAETLRKYLFVEHRAQLEALGLKTQADKNYLIESCFLECSMFITEVDALRESLVFFIEDLDKNLWTLKNLVSVLELTFKNKVGL